MLGVSLKDQTRYEVIQQRTKVIDVAQRISKLKWQWANNYICRRIDDRLVYQIGSILKKTQFKVLLTDEHASKGGCTLMKRKISSSSKYEIRSVESANKLEIKRCKNLCGVVESQCKENIINPQLPCFVAKPVVE
uniref:SFRICE_031541 n=1 Tax=Spodoptera frugiperda TaxID=7108 RepID=A0A2H1WIJ3_SPOFR